MLPRWTARSLLLTGLLLAVLCVALIILMTQVLAPAAQADKPATRAQIWGYYPWWLGEAWRARDLSLYDRLEFFEIEINGEGGLGERNGWPQRWQGLQESAQDRGLPLDVTVTMFSVARFESVFSNPKKRQLLLAELLQLTSSLKGIHLDIEIFDSVSAEALAGYRAFCGELRSGLNQQGANKSLTAFGVMGAATDLYDGPTLAWLDHIVVQGYDSHHLTGPRAGPVAPLRGPYEITWEATLAHYLRLGAPRHKIIFGVPYYGYEWPTDSALVGARALGRGREMTYAALDAQVLPNIRIDARTQAERHGLRRDPASGSPYYVFRDPAGGWRQGWFEDEVSLAAKFAFVKQQGLAGIAIFPVGYDDGVFDKLLRRTFRGK